MKQFEEIFNEEFLKMVLDERLKRLPHNRHDDEYGERIISEGEEIIDRLAEEDKKKVMAYLDMITDDMADYERGAYLGGLKDVIGILKMLKAV